jgi:L-aspartate oxidase
LASNSRLEGLVFGALAAETMVREQGSGLGAEIPAPGTEQRAEKPVLKTDSSQLKAKNSGLKAESRGLKAPGSGAEAGVRSGITTEAATERWINELREVMWKDAGLLRDADGLLRAQRALDALAVTMPRGLFRRAVEARNLHLVAGMIVAAALGREESRGAHFRNDFPLRDAVGRHSVMERGRLEFVA